MFIGPSGKILDKLLSTTSLKRDDIYMTNLVKCMLPNYRKPKQDEIEACSKYLDEEIRLVTPRFIVPMGYYASMYIFDKFDLDVPSRKEIREIYGHLVWSGEKNILPLQHPASVLHDPSIEDILRKNYHKLAIIKNDCKWANT